MAIKQSELEADTPLVREVESDAGTTPSKVAKDCDLEAATPLKPDNYYEVRRIAREQAAEGIPMVEILEQALCKGIRLRGNWVGKPHNTAGGSEGPTMCLSCKLIRASCCDKCCPWRDFISFCQDCESAAKSKLGSRARSVMMAPESWPLIKDHVEKLRRNRRLRMQSPGRAGCNRGFLRSGGGETLPWE